MCFWASLIFRKEARYIRADTIFSHDVAVIATGGLVADSLFDNICMFFFFLHFKASTEKIIFHILE